MATDYETEYVSMCCVCGEPSDYCMGHGEIGDPDGFAIRHQHNAGNHDDCHPDSTECED